MKNTDIFLKESRKEAQNMKRLIAALLTVAMTISIVPFSAFADESGADALLDEAAVESTETQQEDIPLVPENTDDPFQQNDAQEQAVEEQTQQAEVDTSDVSLTATNSFGQLLVNSMDEQNGASGEYSSRITGLKLNGHTATVEFVADQDADLVVAVYTDSDAEEMVASGTVEVSGDGGNSSAAVAVQGDIPEYYTVKTFLLNKTTHEPLSQVYTDVSRTEVMVDLSTAKVSDFPEDRVINLDGQDDTNFAVVSDETTLVTYEDNTAGQNQVISEDDDNLVYVIGNASDEIKNLQLNDILTYEYEPGMMLIARVQSITVDGDTVTIHGNDTLDISDVFDAVKIESDADSGDLTYDGTEADAGVEYNGTSYDEPDEIDLTNAAGQGEIKVGNEFILKEVGDSNLKIKGSIKISLGIKIQYYFANDMTFISDSNEFEVTGAVSFSAKSEGEIKLGSLGVRPIFGLWVGFEPVVKGKAEITGKLQLKYTATIGAEYYSSSGFSNTSKEPEVEFNISAEGSLYIGFDFKPKAKILEKVTVLTLDAEVGAELKGTKKIATIDNETFNDESRHACAGCFEVKVSTIVKVGATLEIIGITPKKKQFAELTLGPLEGYYSPEYDEWGWNKCPHELYRVILSVDQEDPQGISYLMGSMSDVLEGKAKALGGISLENGKMRCYLAPGTYTVAAVKDSNVPYGDATFTITENAVDVQIKAGSIDISKPEPDKPGTGEKPDKPGTSTTMSWSLNENGKLTIEGKGEMDQKGEWNKAEDVPWNAVRSEIKEVEIGNGITSLGKFAFYGCENLTDVVIPSGVTSIGQSCFQNCNKLTEIVIPDGVMEIGFYAFAWCGSLTTITMPRIMSKIGEAAFLHCDNLESIKIPIGITEIGSDTFSNCYSLKNVEIPYGVTRINNNVFRACTSMTSVTIPEGVTHIGSRVFSLCSNLTNIELPASVTIICDGTFEGCRNLKNLKIPARISSIGSYAFSGCVNLDEIDIPSGVDEIGEWAFDACRSLKKLTIPAKVKRIRDSAFRDCSALTNITIPLAVTEIGAYAFYGCSQLTDAIYTGSKSEWKVITVGNQNGPLLSATIHCTDGDIIPASTSSENSVTTGSTTANNGTFCATFDNVSAGKDYAVIISRSANDPLNADNLIYINQVTADADGELSVPFRTGAGTDEMTYIVACARDDVIVDPDQPTEPDIPSDNDSGSSSGGGGDGAGAAVAIIGGVVAVAAVAGVVMLMPVEVSGTVKNAEQAILPGVSVQVLQGDTVVAQTITDEAGHFTVKVRRGDYTLSVSYTDTDGQLATKTIDIKAPNKNMDVAA